MKIKAAVATRASDAALRDRYEQMGAKAYHNGLPRECPCDPNSMIGGWWFGGYDAAADQHS